MIIRRGKRWTEILDLKVGQEQPLEASPICRLQALPHPRAAGTLLRAHLFPPPLGKETQTLPVCTLFSVCQSV